MDCCRKCLGIKVICEDFLEKGNSILNKSHGDHINNVCKLVYEAFGQRPLFSSFVVVLIATYRCLSLHALLILQPNKVHSSYSYSILPLTRIPLLRCIKKNKENLIRLGYSYTTSNSSRARHGKQFAPRIHFGEEPLLPRY